MEFTLHHTDGKARNGELKFDRGTVRTPAFMPVGTYGTVKAMTPGEVRDTGAEGAITGGPSSRTRKVRFTISACAVGIPVAAWSHDDHCA